MQCRLHLRYLGWPLRPEPQERLIQALLQRARAAQDPLLSLQHPTSPCALLLLLLLTGRADCLLRLSLMLSWQQAHDHPACRACLLHAICTSPMPEGGLLAQS